MARAALSYGMPWTCEGRWQYRMYDPPIQFVRIVIPFFPRPARATIATCFYSPTYFLVLLFLLASLPAVPIRRNLIGNQSFWGKNGAWLSVTVPWVFAAERGVQKRLCAGTVVGKVNAADSLSSALFQKEKRKKASLGFFSPLIKYFPCNSTKQSAHNQISRLCEVPHRFSPPATASAVDDFLAQVSSGAVATPVVSVWWHIMMIQKIFHHV